MLVIIVMLYRFSGLGGLGDVVVTVLDIGPKVFMFKPGRRDLFLWAIVIHSKHFFAGEVKPEDRCHKIL
jgi:hypothetical protein